MKCECDLRDRYLHRTYAGRCEFCGRTYKIREVDLGESAFEPLPEEYKKSMDELRDQLERDIREAMKGSSE